MKTNKLMAAATCLLALLTFGAGSALASGSNETNEKNQSQISSDVAKAAASANVGMLGTRISAMTGPSGGFGGGTGGATGGGLGGGLGQGSGNGPMGIGVWALGSGTYMDNSKSGARYDGSLFTGMIGADKQMGDLLVGLAVGYENLDLTTKYNSGKMEYDGWSVVPYLSYSITRDIVLDASFSYTWLDYTMKDTQAGVKYSDSMNANRMVTSAGVTGYMDWDKFLFSARLGTLYLNEHQGSYRLNATDYSKAGIYSWSGTLGLRAQYDMGAFKPFVGATYMQDFIKSGSDSYDMWGTDFDLGFNYMPADGWVIGLTGTYGVRDNLNKAGGLLNVRYDF